MGLMSWAAPRKEVELPGGDSFFVRGLCLEDITKLWGIYGEELFDIFNGMETFASNKDEKEALLQAGLVAWISRLVTEFPDVVSTVIAVVSDVDADLDAVVAQVKLLPVATQVDALNAVYQLSVTEVGGSKKFVSHLSSLLAAMGLSAQATGTGDSASRLAS